MPFPIARAAHWLPILAAFCAVTLVALHPNISSIALMLVALAQLSTLSGYRWLTYLLCSSAIGLLLPGFISYLTPENWVTTANWQALVSWAHPATFESFRAPLLMTLALQLSALSILLHQRARLGAPLLLVATLLLIGLQLAASSQAFTPLLRYEADWPSLLTLGIVLLGQYLQSTPHWRGKRSLTKALWPACGLLVAVLLLWEKLHNEAEQTLYQQVEARALQATHQLSQEIETHLNAMRGFARIWQLQTTLPTSQQWTDQAAGYRQDFTYLINIAFITPDSVIRHVYPINTPNLSLLGRRLFDVQPAGRDVLEPALRGQQEGSTDVIELLQGDPGVIHYFPVLNAQGVPLGAAAMAVSFPMFAETLFAQLPAEEGAVRWHDRTKLLAHHGDATLPGPWAYDYPVNLLDKTLTLSYQPRWEYLVSQLSRLPTISLVTGLILTYLLYLVLYTFQRLGQQHSAMQNSNIHLQQEIHQRSKLQQEVEWLARHDELTGIANRRHFLEQVEALQGVRPISLVLFDIDYFKRINDQLGHLVGDEHLLFFAQLGKSHIEQYGGIFARYGGEEFVAWLPSHHQPSAFQVADELRQKLAASSLSHADGKPLTLSAGIVTISHPENVDLARMMQAADEALYRAKHNGRNRVECGERNTTEGA
ncbi:MAG: hypothetical protein CME80_10835 [Halomonas sp.]|nr:diguanylate cyclase [Halomonas sp.]MBF58195.1 hypothetical protein [Halomonas sp.]